MLVKLAGEGHAQRKHRPDHNDVRKHAADAVRRPRSSNFFGGPTRLADDAALLRHATRRQPRSRLGRATPRSKTASSFRITINCTQPAATAAVRAVAAGRLEQRPGRCVTARSRLTLGNPDGDQPLKSLTMHLPPGMAAMLASVTPCPEPQVAKNECMRRDKPDRALDRGLGPRRQPVHAARQGLHHRAHTRARRSACRW